LKECQIFWQGKVLVGGYCGRPHRLRSGGRELLYRLLQVERFWFRRDTHLRAPRFPDNGLLYSGV